MTITDQDGITLENGSEYNKITKNIVDCSCQSHVIATQSWVSTILKRFCAWTNVFHTGILHAANRVCTGKVEADTAVASEVQAKTISLVNDNGMVVKLTVGDNGKLVISQNLCEVYVYPGPTTLVREYLYRRRSNVVRDFAGLTPQQTLLNFIPFVSDKVEEFNGRPCQFLCTADGSDDLITKTLLFNFPAAKRAKNLVLMDASCEVVKTIALPTDVGNIRQLTINMPSFKHPETEAVTRVQLPLPIPDWAGGFPGPFPMPLPPAGCGGFIPPGENGAIPSDFHDIGADIFADDDESTGQNSLDPSVAYRIVNEDYDGGTYYNVCLHKVDFTNTPGVKFLGVELEAVDPIEDLPPPIDPFADDEPQG